MSKLKTRVLKGYRIVHSFDKENQLHTVSTLSPGGPIATGKTLPKTLKDFEEMIDVAESVQKLIEFNKIRPSVNWPTIKHSHKK